MSRAEWEHREGEEAMTKYRPSQGQHQEPGSHRLFHSGANLSILNPESFVPALELDRLCVNLIFTRGIPGGNFPLGKVTVI